MNWYKELKIKESAFEGVPYTPEVERKMERRLNKKRNKIISPPDKGIKPKRSPGGRFRNTYLDRAPDYSIPSAQNVEFERNQSFYSTIEQDRIKQVKRQEIEEREKQRFEYVKNWIIYIQGEEVRNKLFTFLQNTWKRGPGGDSELNMMYNASLGTENSLKALENRIGEKIIIEQNIED